MRWRGRFTVRATRPVAIRIRISFVLSPVKTEAPEIVSNWIPVILRSVTFIARVSDRCEGLLRGLRFSGGRLNEDELDHCRQGPSLALCTALEFLLIFFGDPCPNCHLPIYCRFLCHDATLSALPVFGQQDSANSCKIVLRSVI